MCTDHEHLSTGGSPKPHEPRLCRRVLEVRAIERSRQPRESLVSVARHSRPEEFLAGRPLLLVTVIFVQIVVSLVLVGVLARREPAVPDCDGAIRGAT